MKRLFLSLLAIFGVAIFITGFATVLLRDIPAGTYDLTSTDATRSQDASKGWAQVESLLPIMHLYGPQGASGPTIVLIPVIQKGVSLQWGWPTLSYGTTNSDAVEISFAAPHASQVELRPVSNADAAQIRQTWEAEHERLNRELATIAQADIMPAWQTPLFDGAFSLSIPDSYVLRAFPSNTAYPGVRMVPRGDAIDGNTYLEFVATRGGSGNGAVNSATAESRHDPDAIQAGPNAMVTRTPEHIYRVFASYRFGDVEVIARGRTPDMESAEDFVGVLNAIEAGDAPLELLSGDYLPAVEPVGADTVRIPTDYMADLLSTLLRPENLLSQYGFAQPQTVFLPDAQGREDSRGGPASVVIGLLPRGNRFPQTDFTVKAEAEDRALRVSIDEDNAACIVEFVLPIGEYSESDSLVLLLILQSSSLPDCQDAARFFAQLDPDDLRQRPAMKQAIALAPHAGKYSDVRAWEDGTISVSDGGQSGLIDPDGEVLLMIEATTIRPLLGNWQFQLDGRYGLIDADERVILPAEYDEISIMAGYGPDEDAGRLQVRKDGKVGIFDVANERFVLSPSFDEIVPITLWDIFRAHDGDTFRLVSMTGEDVLPQDFTEYIIGEPARASANERDFIALRTTDGAWVFHTRVPQPLLEGQFSDLRMERRPASRLFHLTRPDGTTLTIDSFLEPVEQRGN